MARQETPEMARLVHDGGATVVVLAEDAAKMIATGVFEPEGGDRSKYPAPVGAGGGGDLDFDDEDFDLEAATVAQLKDYARHHRINLGKATRKDDIIEAILEPD